MPTQLLLEETTPPPQPTPARRTPRAAAIATLVLAVAAAEITAAIIGHAGYALVLFGILLFTGFGTAVAIAIYGELRRDTWLRHNGITVTADRIGRGRYTYTDVIGTRYTVGGTGGEHIAVRYDPGDPSRSMPHLPIGERCVLAAGGAFGAILALGGLLAVTRLFGQALGE